MTVAEAVSATQSSTEIVAGDVPGGPSTSQTIMVSSLRRLLANLPPDALPDAYRAAVMDENVLGKQTVSAREWAFRQLRRFYALDPNSVLFRALRDLWDHEKSGQPLLAILCALARDPVLRATAQVIISTDAGGIVGPSEFEAAIEARFPGAYKENTRHTTAQKVASSWSQSGHLYQKKPGTKVRTRVRPTAAVTAYALMLGYLEGARGQALLDTLWVQMLDQPTSHLMDLAATASQFGMLEFRHAGGVVEITFHQLLRSFNGAQGAMQ
ncbi:hypothetical protein K1W54_08485 [Micromonospora sp. CPCC 205371]|nr:hypothetical protein [Micromonospora sp. CPCC 205371]